MLISSLFLKDMGVSTWAVIHCPEIGCGLDENNNFVEVPSLKLPEGWIVGTVGAGDAMVGGLLKGLEVEGDMARAFRYGVAAGAASVMTEGTQLIVPEDFDNLLGQVKVQEV